jgi:hypothetical protein
VRNEAGSGVEGSRSLVVVTRAQTIANQSAKAIEKLRSPWPVVAIAVFGAVLVAAGWVFARGILKGPSTVEIVAAVVQTILATLGGALGSRAYSTNRERAQRLAHLLVLKRELDTALEEVAEVSKSESEEHAS